MQDRPNAQELLAAVGDFLEHEVMPGVSGPLQYRSRVALNLVRILEREAMLEPAHLARERERLSALVGAETGSSMHNPVDSRSDASSDAQSPSTPRADLQAQVLELNRRLVADIETATSMTPEREAAIHSALLEIARAKLAICRPGYANFDDGAKRNP